jgi:transcriptional regulator with XRE-family HTH domain
VPTPGELLTTVRHRHGLTQSQLAARARTSQAAISRLERGLVSPSVATLQELLDLMGEELVIQAEAIDYGHDRTLYARTLRYSPEERIANQASWSRSMNELRNAGRR